MRAPSPLRSSAYIFCAQLINGFLAVAMVAVIAARSPESVAAVFFYCFAIASGVESLSDLGARFSVVRHCSAGKASLVGALRECAWLVKSSLAVFVAGIVGLAWSAGLVGFQDSFAAYALTVLVAITLPSSSPIVWFLRGADRQHIEAIGLVVYRLIMLALVYFGGPHHDATHLLALVLTANVLLQLGLFPFVYQQRGSVARHRDRLLPTAVFLLREGSPLGLSLFTSQIAMRSWIIILGTSVADGAIVGYAVSHQLIQATLIAGVALGVGYLPTLARASTVKDLDRGSGELLDFAMDVGFAAAMFLALGSPVLCSLVLSDGEALQYGAEALRVSAWAAPGMIVALLIRYIRAPRSEGLRGRLGDLLSVAAVYSLAIPMAVWSAANAFDITYYAILFVVAESSVAVLKLLLLKVGGWLRARMVRRCLFNVVSTVLLTISAFSLGVHYDLGDMGMCVLGSVIATIHLVVLQGASLLRLLRNLATGMGY